MLITTKTETAIEIHYFNKLQSMTMKQITNVHTGYIHKLISKVSMDFFEVIWEIEASVIPLIMGGILVFAMLCREKVYDKWSIYWFNGFIISGYYN